MTKIFISYSRTDQIKVNEIVKDIGDLGHEVWLDQKLSGGQKWWDEILTEIQITDIFVFILSPESRESIACSKEYAYANSLGKPVIPVQVAEGVSTDLLPHVLSQVQIVNYLQPNREAVKHLSRSLNSVMVSQALPNPLPDPPDPPLSYLGNITNEIESTPNLTYNQQSALLLDIKKGINDLNYNNEDGIKLLEKLRSRKELYANIADEIDSTIMKFKPDNNSLKKESINIIKSELFNIKYIYLIFILLLTYISYFYINNNKEKILIKDNNKELLKIETISKSYEIPSIEILGDTIILSLKSNDEKIFKRILPTARDVKELQALTNKDGQAELMDELVDITDNKSAFSSLVKSGKEFKIDWNKIKKIRVVADILKDKSSGLTFSDAIRIEFTHEKESYVIGTNDSIKSKRGWVFFDSIGLYRNKQ